MTSSTSNLNTPPIVDVMGLPLWSVNRAEFINLLVDRARSGVRTRVCYVNAHSWNIRRRVPSFRKALATADVLYADGMSMVWASRLLGSPLPARLSSADYVEEFVRACAETGVSLYLLGGREGIAQAAANWMCSIAPGLKICGTDNGHFDLSTGPAVIHRINEANPNLLMVGMGSPRQEEWAAENQHKLKVPVIWTVGALFDYPAGVESRAPAWMCRAGLEWLFRLGVDPKGKAGRYLIGNPLFAGSLAAAVLRRAFRGSHGGLGRAIAE